MKQEAFTVAQQERLALLGVDHQEAEHLLDTCTATQVMRLAEAGVPMWLFASRVRRPGDVDAAMVEFKATEADQRPGYQPITSTDRAELLAAGVYEDQVGYAVRLRWIGASQDEVLQLAEAGVPLYCAAKLRSAGGRHSDVIDLFQQGADIRAAADLLRTQDMGSIRQLARAGVNLWEFERQLRDGKDADQAMVEFKATEADQRSDYRPITSAERAELLAAGVRDDQVGYAVRLRWLGDTHQAVLEQAVAGADLGAAARLRDLGATPQQVLDAQGSGTSLALLAHVLRYCTMEQALRLAHACAVQPFLTLLPEEDATEQDVLDVAAHLGVDLSIRSTA